MKGFKFSGLRQSTEWITPAWISVDYEGLITSIATKPQGEVEYEEVQGLALPAITNAHSHAFQYAMSGLAEVHPAGKSSKDFWSWRSKMYEIALTIDPDDIQHIATMLYAEMVRHGYDHVVEFHYLHHDKDGRPFSNIAETGERLVQAALTAGINITLVPMLYEMGGFNKPPENHQRRFMCLPEQYVDLLESSRKITEKFPHAHLGYGAHSLRAARKETMLYIINECNDQYPFHIHIAEQLREVEEAQEYLKKRPVEWLLENFPVNENYHLVHATHVTDGEAKGIATSGANVILCPTTEGNLGDGIFPFHKYQENNGRWCIGTDSHIGINPLEEIRLLDYGQRLTSHKRNTFSPSGGDAAAHALEQVIYNGRNAAGKPTRDNFFEVGQPMDALVVDESHPLLADAFPYRLSTIFYHFDVSEFYGTIINGKWIVKEGIHLHRSSIQSAFSKTLDKLKFRNR
jgi:formimidoylglutamate deiminase